MTLRVTLVSPINSSEGDRLRNMHLPNQRISQRFTTLALERKLNDTLSHIPAVYKKRRGGILNSKGLNKAGIRRTREHIDRTYG